MRPRGADIMNMKPDSASMFRDLRTVFQCIENTVDAVILHGDQVT